jgi:hypothetical protein
MVLNMSILIMFRRSKYLLATVVATAVLLLPVLMPILLSTNTVSAETMDEARENAIKYSYTVAVRSCIDQDALHKDSDHVELGQKPETWMKGGYNTNIGYVVDGENGNRDCKNLMESAMRHFGYDANHYGDFFKDMGYRCSTTSCQFDGSTKDQTHNFQTVISRKKLPTTTTPAMATLLHLAAFQTKCEAQEVTEPNDAAIEDAINLRNDTTVVYYAKSDAGILSLGTTVFKYDTNNYLNTLTYGADPIRDQQEQCDDTAPKLRDASKAAAEQQIKEFGEKKKELYLNAAIKARCGEASTSPGYIRCSDEVKAAFATCYAKAFGGGTGLGSGANPDDVATKGDQGLANCLAAATGTSADTYMTAFQSVKAELDALANSYQTSTSTQTDDSDDCPLPSDAEMRWLGCAVFGLLRKATETLHDYIQQFLYVSVSNIFNDNIKNVSNSFRAIAIGIIILAGLTMIISQALGFELFDAYTIKKLLPRLIVALLGVALAWPLMKLLVILFNDLGLGVGDVLDKVSGYGTTSTDGVGSGSGLIAGLAILPALFGIIKFMGVLGGLSLIGTAVLSMFIGMIVLAIRQVLILMCVILAPFAIACYVLPGTQKVWAFWKNTFLTTLFMYPIIMLFISAGRFTSATIGSNGSSGAMNMLAVMMYFAPYFMLPYAFKLAGGLMSTIFGLANDRNRGVFDRMKKFRGNQMGKRMQHRGNRINRATTERQASLQRAMKARASRSGRIGKVLYGAGASAMDGYQGNLEARVSAYQAAGSKELNDQIATGMDDEIRGLTVNKRSATRLGMSGTTNSDGYEYSNADANGMTQMRIKRTGDDAGTRQFRTLGGAWVDEAAVDRGHKRWGSDTNAQQAALSYEMRKANSEQEVNNINSGYANLATGAGGWGMTDTQAGGAWIGAAFENQNQHMEYKKTNWQSGELGSDGYQGLVDEIYEKKGSYPLSQMHSRTIERLKQAHNDAQQIIDSGQVQGADGSLRAASVDEIAVAEDRQRKLRSIAETFMHDAGMAMNDKGEPVGPRPDGTGKRVVAGQGAGHTNERVWELAEMTGARAAQATGTHSGPATHTQVPSLNPRTGTQVIDNQQSQH